MAMPDGRVPPYENPMRLKAFRLTYDDHANVVVLQLDVESYVQTATDQSQIHGDLVLSLLLDEVRTAELHESLQLLQRFFPVP